MEPVEMVVVLVEPMVGVPVGCGDGEAIEKRIQIP